MKIGVVYTGLYPPLKGGSGADRRVRDLTRGIASANNEVFMFVPIWQDKGQSNPDSDDFEINYLGTTGGITKLTKRIGFWKAVRKRVFDLKLNAVLFYNPTIESYWSIKKIRLSGITTIAEYCDLVSSNYSTSLLMNPKNFLWKLGEDYTPRATNLNIVISEYLHRKIALDAPKTPILSIPILVDPETFKLDLNSAESFRKQHKIPLGNFVIGYAGGIWYNEGVDFLINAFAELAKKYSNISLVIAGKLGNTFEHVDAEKMVKELGLEGKVILAGWVNTKTLVSIYSTSDVLTVPQIDSSFCIAGLPTKLAEYSSFGKAILATSVGDVPKYFEHKRNSVLAMPSDVEDLAEKIEMLINDPKLCKKIGENAKKTAHEVFHYKVNGKKITETINKISKK